MLLFGADVRRFVAIATSVLGIASLLAGPALAEDDVTEVCRFSDPRFTEISGMTYSQRHADVLYLHNDSSGGPLLFAVDATTCDRLAKGTEFPAMKDAMKAFSSGLPGL